MNSGEAYYLPIDPGAILIFPWAGAVACNCVGAIVGAIPTAHRRPVDVDELRRADGERGLTRFLTLAYRF